MKVWSDFLEESGEYSAIRRALREKKKAEAGAVAVFGCVDAAKAHLVESLGQGYDYRLLITGDEIKARQYVEDLRNFEENVWYYPARDLLFFNADLQGNEIIANRMTVLSRLLEYSSGTVVTTIDGLMDYLMPLSVIRQNVIQIHPQDILDLSKLRKQLIFMGYSFAGRVESPGQFSIRGGIVDIFALTEDDPVRIELWDDEVDTIRYYDTKSQRSLEGFLDCLRIYPASEVVLDEGSVYAGLHKIEDETKAVVQKLRDQNQLEAASRLKKTMDTVAEDMKNGFISGAVNGFLSYFYDEQVSFLDYFPENTLVLLDEPARLEEKMHATALEYTESMQMRLEKGYILPGQADGLRVRKQVSYDLEKRSLVVLGGLEQKDSLVRTGLHTTLLSRNANSYQNRVNDLVADLKKWLREQYRVVIVCPSKTRGQRMAESLMKDYEIPADYTADPETMPYPGRVLVMPGTLARGFEYPLLRFVIITENDLFGSRRKKKRKKYHDKGQVLGSMQDLNPGDYVVHESYGIGVYRGVKQVENQGVTKDYLMVEYKDGGNLYIPTSSFDLIQKYASADVENPPKITNLGSKEWKKTQTKVKGAVQQVAKELVKLYATRQNTKGYQCGPDTVWQTEFEELFPYEETEDQLKAIEEVKADMESDKIMDRLLCGDVGFGKTEVALRAAFKAVQEGKQVVYLCPTTILAQQHYNTFVERLGKYPVRVDLLCRFRTPKQQKDTLNGLKNGLVDIVIGTHRVLSKDVLFKDLGLLIIDEEQRFGVRHKEKIKQMKTKVDVLTLTATPIPRTLHMSLIGIRDLSMLEDAPNDRMPIQTYVMEHDDELIREAIKRELARNGQVYYVHNKVADLISLTAKLQDMLPDAVIEYAHGQMTERELERIMLDFVNGEIDVLVSTTIIETGLDIPNVNTIIIQNADRFGLSQLYQLRGRVGRSNRTAYAFMTYEPGRILREVAEKRLAAIRQFTELGSGVKIAKQDLDIRGAGSVLGADQSGHLEAVGYDLYCKMLKMAIRNLQIDVNENPMDIFETQLKVPITAYIPQSYIQDEGEKLDMYKRIATIECQKDYHDVMDELVDRFGDPEPCVVNLLQVALTKAKAHRCFMTDVRATQTEITMKLVKEAPLNGQDMMRFMNEYGGRIRFLPGDQPTLVYAELKGELLTEVDHMIILNQLLDKMYQEVVLQTRE